MRPESTDAPSPFAPSEVEMRDTDAAPATRPSTVLRTNGKGVGPLRLDTSAPGFEAAFAALVDARRDTDEDVTRDVAAILADVRMRGDAAVAERTLAFDRHDLASHRLADRRAACRAALDALDPALRTAIELAATRIRAYHEGQRPTDRDTTDDAGVRLGARWSAVDAAGLYVPGGRAAYPSSVLMNAIPAKVAGVGRLVMVTPTPNGEINPLVLAAAEIAGIDEIWRIGGAQAVAALAYGTRADRRGRRDRRPRQCLGRRGQAPALRSRRDRHGRGAVRDRRHRGWRQRSRVDRRRPAQPGRARPD